MGKRYVNPPIIEAVCEIRFTPDQKWDFTIAGLLFEKVKNEFPSKGQAALGAINRPLAELAVFSSEETKTSIRVGSQLPMLSIMKQKPYSSWIEFKPRIEKAYNELKAIDGVEIKGIQRIGLRYINLIEIPQETVQLEDYFEYAPYLGERLPKELRTFLLGSEFNFSDGRDVCRVQLASALPSQTGQYRANLDLDYYLAQPQAVSPDEVIAWVENAHTKLEELFEGCITDKTRDLFGESK
jgi:uncharacterized protein (TIGR04255 family)